MQLKILFDKFKKTTIIIFTFQRGQWAFGDGALEIIPAE